MPRDEESSRSESGSLRDDTEVDEDASSTQAAQRYGERRLSQLARDLGALWKEDEWKVVVGRFSRPNGKRDFCASFIYTGQGAPVKFRTAAEVKQHFKKPQPPPTPPASPSIKKPKAVKRGPVAWGGASEKRPRHIPEPQQQQPPPPPPHHIHLQPSPALEAVQALIGAMRQRFLVDNHVVQLVDLTDEHKEEYLKAFDDEIIWSGVTINHVKTYPWNALMGQERVKVLWERVVDLYPSAGSDRRIVEALSKILADQDASVAPVICRLKAALCGLGLSGASDLSQKFGWYNYLKGVNRS